MFGTTSWRVPSGLVMSIAMPRLIVSGSTSVGLPSTTSYATFIAGTILSACTIAYPMRCVNETLPPIVRARWALIIVRWSMASFMGTVRTLVAVGISSELSMFFAVRKGAPRRVAWVGWPVMGAGRVEKLAVCAARD